MNIYLGGGWNPEGGEKSLNEQLSCITSIFNHSMTKEVLHIPFARTGIMKKNRNAFGPASFQDFIESLGITYKNASYIEDIESFSGDTIYINGGNDCEFLMSMCCNPLLLKAILRSKTIVGESCGSMILATYFLSNKNDIRINGLNLIKDSVIVPHYTEWDNKNILLEGKKECNVKFGVGIDEITFIKYENGSYGETFGSGKVFHL